MWAGFLSWPLVKQTSKVGRQRSPLVLTASFTSSTAFSTSTFSKFIRLHHHPPPFSTPALLLLYLINQQRIVMVKPLPSCSLLQPGCRRLNRRAADKRLLTQRSALCSSCTVARDTSCNVAAQGQSAQVPKQGSLI